jgi:hypothetical protein
LRNAATDQVYWGRIAATATSEAARLTSPRGGHGRPKVLPDASSNARRKALRSGAHRLNKEIPALQRRAVLDMIDSRIAAGASTGGKFWGGLQAETGYNCRSLKQLVSPAKRAQLAGYEDARRTRAGRSRYWARWDPPTEGKRLSKTGGAVQKALTAPASFYRPLEQLVCEWAREEVEAGHSLDAADLLDRYLLEVEDRLLTTALDRSELHSQSNRLRSVRISGLG